MPELTIGMATYKEFDGVYFTLQSLRMYHATEDVEFIVIDNYGCEDTKRFVQSIRGAKYVRALDAVGTAAPRNRVFTEASGTYVLCCDSHVQFVSGAIDALRAYYRAHPDTQDLIQGPLVYDDMRSISTHFDPVWRSQMWGTWATDPRGNDPNGEAFDIPSQGLGVFSCRKDAWLGFNPMFRGFGGEEGYIHEKFRQAGHRSLCLPALRWVHRFARPAGVPYPLTVNDKFRNYVIGHTELGLDLTPAIDHFLEHLPEAQIRAILREILGVDQYVTPVASPPAEELGFTPITDWAEPASAAPAASVASGVSAFSAFSAAPAPASGDRPMVSCLCLTYNRPPQYLTLLQEAVQSFVHQDYPNKELIIVNDTPTQELICNVPGVRVINVPERFASLGAKQNYALAQAKGELIAIWDDDDISLPWRLSASVDRIRDRDYFNPGSHWYLDSEGLHHTQSMGVAVNASLFRRSAIEGVGGFDPDPERSASTDQTLNRALRSSEVPIAPPLDGIDEIGEWFYLFRWSVSPTHISGYGRSDAWQIVGERPIQKGRFQIVPRWYRDYLALTREHLQKAALPLGERPKNVSELTPARPKRDGG